MKMIVYIIVFSKIFSMLENSTLVTFGAEKSLIIAQNSEFSELIFHSLFDLFYNYFILLYRFPFHFTGEQVSREHISQAHFTRKTFFAEKFIVGTKLFISPLKYSAILRARLAQF